MKITLEQEITERENSARLHRKLDRCLQDIKFQLHEERKRAEQYTIGLAKAKNHLNN